MSEVNRLLADRYLLGELIGQGGMADVYLAEDKVLRRTVAVKILRSSLTGDPIYIKRFHREASAAAAINHKNIVAIYDVGDEDDLYYIVMEYVKGQTLKELINIRGALHYIEAIDIMKQVVSATATAHEMGIVHRDLKPQNILVTDSGIVKIADFGIASIQSLSQVTQTDTIMGSLHYLAPEIARGEKATPQSDIYALGIVFYELLRGEVPFNGESPVNIALKHMRDSIPSVRAFNPSIPQSVENIIIKATAKNVENRYASALDMLDDIATCLVRTEEEKLTFDVPVEEPTIVAQDTEFFTKTKNEGIVENEVPEPTTTTTRVSRSKTAEPKKKKSKAKLIVVLLALVLLGFGIGYFYYMDANKTYKMPDLVGLSKSDAKKKLEKNGFKGAITYESELSDKYDKNYVISTNPKAGKNMEKDTAIVITVSKGKYDIMSDYTNYTYEAAKKELEDLGYTVTKYEKSDDNVEEGRVIGQSIAPGEKRDPNETNKTITLTVSKGVTIMVPYLYGDTIKSATKTLESAGFKVKTKVLSLPSDANERAKITKDKINIVIRQSLAPYSTVNKRGTTITLYYYDKVPEVENDNTQVTPNQDNNTDNNNNNNSNTNNNNSNNNNSNNQNNTTNNT
jgi:serine/threonine-protein kinase